MGARQRKSYSPLLAYIAEAPEVFDSDTDLIERFKTGDSRAGFLLLVKHHRMVLQVILDLTKGRWFNDDCLQAGGVGLFEAAKRFDPGRGFTFLTMAVPWIYKFVLKELSNEILPIGGIMIGRDLKSRLYKYIGLKMTGLPDPEIQRMMRVSDKEIKKLATMALQLSRPVSLDGEVNSGNQGSAEETGQLYPVISADGLPSVGSAENEYIDDHDVEYTAGLINKLENPNQRYIMNAIYGLNGVAAQDNKTIAKRLRLTMPQFHFARREAVYQFKVILRNTDFDRYRAFVEDLPGDVTQLHAFAE